MRPILLIIRFYSSFFIANFCITLSALGLIEYYGSRAHLIITTLIWYKILTMAVILYTVFIWKKHELYYYQSLGITKFKLIWSTSAIDFSLYLVLLYVTYNNL
ncbi:hypothetical protein SAMN05192574_102441 [Mucilaginibacter gossypiicola]|uniref:Uncharacterized protein n=2 Tax=Mucilaginibacter gossypiicola TaxID=551995 RepID=A0A1H8DRA1_9SPHI|nr:hypothetical protein SAMN05192574_102441 [Mucilaginibacter gossypiicola]